MHRTEVGTDGWTNQSHKVICSARLASNNPGRRLLSSVAFVPGPEGVVGHPDQPPDELHASTK